MGLIQMVEKYTSKQEYVAFYWNNNPEDLKKWLNGLVLDYDKSILFTPYDHLLQGLWDLELFIRGKLKVQLVLNENNPQWVVMDIETNRFFVFADELFSARFKEVKE